MKKLISIYSKMVYVMVLVQVASLVFMLIVLMTSCTAQRKWYKATGDGCRQSAGFAGYGNKH